jgi:hypothetical protein
MDIRRAAEHPVHHPRRGRRARTARVSALAVGLALFPLLPAPAAAGEAGSEAEVRASSPLSGWSTLVLDGRKFLVAKGRSEIRRYGADTATAVPERVGVVSDAWLLGAHVGEHRALSTAHPTDALTAGWKGWVPEEKLRVARLEGCTLSVVDYRGPEDDDVPEGAGWKLHRERTVEIPAGDARDEPARGPWDVYALLARLGPLARGEEPMRVRMLTKRGEVLAVVERSGETVFDRRVERLDDGSRVDLELPVVQLELKPAPEAADAEHLLDMRGPVRMLVDPVSGALVRIEGTHAGLDRKIRLTLDSFGRKPPPPLSPPAP